MGNQTLSDRPLNAAACGNKANRRKWRTSVAALLGVASLASCTSTSPQPEIAAGQRSCVIYHPYYYNGDKRQGETEIRNALTVQLGTGEKYALRPYRSLQVPIPRGGTTVEVLDDPLLTLGSPRKSEGTRIPEGGQTGYVRISRSQGIGGMATTPSGIPVAVAAYTADRAKLVAPEIAKKELAEFE
jgi:hypothetical protein